MGKLIAVYGANGSGKSTVASNLAFMLSKANLTGIVGTNTNYGSIQHFFGMHIDDDKNLRNVIISKGRTDNAKNFRQHPTQENLFVLSMPNDDTCLKLADPALDIDTGSAVDILVSLKERFDFLVVDCTNSIKDALSIYSLVYADKVVNVIRPNVQGLSFVNAYKVLFESLMVFDDRMINISNADKNSVGLSIFEKQAGIKFSVSLPYCESVELSEGQGIPLSQSMKRSTSRFNGDYLGNLKILLSLVQGGNIIGKL